MHVTFFLDVLEACRRKAVSHLRHTVRRQDLKDFQCSSGLWLHGMRPRGVISVNDNQYMAQCPEVEARKSMPLEHSAHAYFFSDRQSTVQVPRIRDQHHLKHYDSKSDDDQQVLSVANPWDEVRGEGDLHGHSMFIHMAGRRWEALTLLRILASSLDPACLFS